MPNELTPEEKDVKRQAFLALDVKNEDFSKLPAQQTPPPDSVMRNGKHCA